MKLAGTLVTGWQLGHLVLVALTPKAQAQDAAFMPAKVAMSRFSAEHNILVKADATGDAMVGGAASATAAPGRAR